MLIRIKKDSPFTIYFIAFIYTLFLHLVLGMDSSFDMVNYHYYIGWAALHLKHFDYGAISGYETFFNPLLDIVNYLFFSFSAYFGAILHSIIFSLIIVLSYKIFLRIFASESNEDAKFLAFLAICIGATAAMTVSLFGTFTNEHQNALLILISLWLLIEKQEKYSGILGLILGCAVGFKLTAAIYAVALILTSLLFSKNKFHTLIMLGMGSLTGFLITDGFFMIRRWQELGNPFFPVANGIFHSPYFGNQWFSFNQFELTKIPYYLSLPIHWLYDHDFSESWSVRDSRMLLAYLGLVLLTFSCFIQKKKLTQNEKVIICFFISSWIIWILFFRIYRYLVMLELLTGFIFLLGIIKTIPIKKTNYWPLSYLLILATFLLATTQYPNWGRRQWSQHFFEINLPNIVTKGDSILLADSRLSFMVPFMLKNHLFFGRLDNQPWFPQSLPITKYPINESSIERLFFLQYSGRPPGQVSDYIAKKAGNRVFQCNLLDMNLGWPLYLCRYQNLEQVLKPLEMNVIYTQLCKCIYFQSGWLAPEKDRILCSGKKSTILLLLPKNNVKKKLALTGYTVNTQQIIIFINNKKLFDGIVRGDFSWQLPLDLSASEQNLPLKIDFEFPDAKMMSDEDPRKLAFALQTIAIVDGRGGS